MSYRNPHPRRANNAFKASAELANPKVTQLQELFPSWSDDDLKSLLVDVNYDLELAATRISEGHAEQWGAVSHKKEKRSSTPAPAAQANKQGSDSERGARGARGGRGGARGGRTARGGGIGRGGHRETNGRHPPSSASQPVTTEESVTSPDAQVKVNGDSAAAAAEPSSEGANDWGTGDNSATPSTWGKPANHTAEQKSQVPSSAQTSANQLVSKAPAPAPVPAKKTWAQIAKPQEKAKPAPVAAPAPPPVVTPPVVIPEPTPAPPEPEVQIQPETQGWEDPATVQAPTWDDEPATTVTTVEETVPETQPEEIVSEPEPTQPAVTEPEPEPETVTAPSVVAPAPSPFPVQLSNNRKESPAPAKPTTPVSYARSLNSRMGNRFKTDQAVTLPLTFGSSVEKLGMQFGSVNLNGDDVDAPAAESSATLEPAAPPSAPEPVQEPEPQPAAPQPGAVPKPLVPTPHAQVSLTTSTESIFQQTLVQEAQPQQPASQPQVHSSLQSAQPTTPSLLPSQSSQTSISTQTTTSTAASTTPLTSFASTQHTTPQSSISSFAQHSQAQSQASQTQSPAQSQNTTQQSPAPSHHQPQPQQQSSLHQGIHSNGSYYRQPEQNFYHTPTPPAGQAQDAPYGSFAPLTQQLSHQAQGSHLSSFGSDHFGYNDAPRGFYDSYGQQSSFAGRSTLAHDDISKTIPGTQQQTQTSSGLPQSASQSNQQSSQQPQSSAQPQAPAAGQPQQGYPVPYYYNPYNHPSQLYGAPYGSGYGFNQYANRFQPPQQPMFQPANPTSASPANAKGPGSVQPQSNPYAPGLYTQQHASSAYDDGYGHHGQLGHQHSQGVGALPGSDYGKQMYGAQGIQSFMGQSNANPAAQLGQRGAAASGAGAAGSPENTYKPYGPGGVGVGGKDVGGAPGVGAGIAGAQSGLGQPTRGVQQPQHSQGFYGANRFSATPTAGGPPGQPTQQQNQGYPQGGSYSGFDYGQRPSQNGYWQ